MEAGKPPLFEKPRIGKHPYNLFAMLAFLAFVVADVGSDVVARTTISGETFDYAVREHLYFAALQFIGTAMLFTPFLVLAWMSASLTVQASLWRGFSVFVLGILMLLPLYYNGYQASQIALESHAWTAAALSVGFLPFLSVPLLLVCVGFRWLLGRVPKPGSGS